MEEGFNYKKDNMDCWNCEFMEFIVNRFNTPFFNQAGSGLLNSEGTMIPFSELANSKDCCEINNKLGHSDHCNCPDFNQRFQLVDEDTGDPIAGMQYEIVVKSGKNTIGITDDNGFTQKIQGKIQETGEIKIYHNHNGVHK